MAEITTPIYDIIFAGGGATACVVAGRLAEADPTLKILVLEAGPHTKDVPKHVQPARYLPTVASADPTVSIIMSKANPKANNRSTFTTAGRCLGGGSVINFMVYCRAAASDYDDWESIHGNKGWGSRSLIPLLRKAETYQAVTTNNTHGKSGPLKVSFAKSNHNVASEFLEVSEAYDTERGLIDDLNGLYACNGYARWARFIDGKTGKRSDAASGYIYPLLDSRKNLEIKARKLVVRVIFEGKRAIGVKYVDDEGDHTQALQSPSVARASRLVVLSAGAFGSPAILERSGIGSAELLRKNDVLQLVDLPGVGEHLMNHNVIAPHYFAADYADTLDGIFRGGEEAIKPYFEKWSHTGQGLLSQNGMDAGIRLRPNADDLKEIGPSFTERWNNHFANAPDKPIMMLTAMAGCLIDGSDLAGRKGFSMPLHATYPMSFGHSHITSGSNPYAPLNYDPRQLHEEADLHVLRWAYKHSRELARRMPLYRGEVVTDHPKYPEGSEAISKDVNEPVAFDAPKIKYTEADDRAIDEYIRNAVVSSGHGCGTCSMKPREKGGVVDERLNVYGVEGLKVADLSILPSNVGANPYNTAVAIGEKAAVIIAQDLGVKGVTESD